jgi:hypothetical protein
VYKPPLSKVSDLPEGRVRSHARSRARAIPPHTYPTDRLITIRYAIPGQANPEPVPVLHGRPLVHSYNALVVKWAFACAAGLGDYAQIACQDPIGPESLQVHCVTQSGAKETQQSLGRGAFCLETRRELHIGRHVSNRFAVGGERDDQCGDGCGR